MARLVSRSRDEPWRTPGDRGRPGGHRLASVIARRVRPGLARWERRIEILRTVGRHGLGVAIGHSGFGRLVPFHHGALHHQRRDLPYERHEHLRMLFEDLGATYIKLGQILSSRPDLLAERYRAELAHLQDAVPVDATTDAAATIEHELGRPLAEVFQEFTHEPLASASIGQAFSATLVDGTEVVVKVRRPGVVDRITLDLDLLGRAARHVAWVWPAARKFGLAELVDEFSATLLAEVDYEAEGRNAERIAANLGDYPGVRVPRIHWHATTPSVLTMDRALGLRIDSVDARGQARITGPTLARNVVAVVLHMVIVDGYFHADPHPGNLLLAPDATIELIDFGMVGELPGDLQQHLAALLTSMIARDADGICACLTQLGIATSVQPVEPLRADLSALLDTYGDQPLGSIGFGAMLHDHLEVARRHRLRLPTQLALLAKVLLMTEGIAARLDPDFEVISAFASITASDRQRGPDKGRVDHHHGRGAQAS